MKAIKEQPTDTDFPACSGRIFPIGLGVISLLFVTLAILASAGLRGSDQYWYVVEVEQILAGKPFSHIVFPYHAFHGFVPPPLNHHTLIHYLVLPFAAWFGAYEGWVIVNTLASLLGACAVAELLRQKVGAAAALIGFGLSLLLPLSYWINAQPYLEGVLASFLSVGLFILFTKMERNIKWWSIFALSIAACLCRLSYFPLLIIIPIAYYRSRKSTKRRVALMEGVAMLVAGLTVLSISSQVMVADPALSFSRYLTATIPGRSDNMHVLYSIHAESFQMSLLGLKLVGAFTKQFLPNQLALQIFYLPFNIMALVLCCYLWRTRKSLDRRLLVVSLIFFTIHIGTVVLRANEFRFLAMSSPLMIVGAVLFLAEQTPLTSTRKGLGLCLFVLMSFVVLDCVLLKKMRGQQRSDLALKHELAYRLNSKIPAADSIVFSANDDSDTYVREEYVLSYAVRPRQILFVRPAYRYSSGELETMIQRVDARWLLDKHGGRRLNFAHYRGDPIDLKLPTPFHDYRLFRLVEK